MKIGFVSIYPFRPHVKHIAFLANEAKRHGHTVFRLECNNSVDVCVSKLGKTSLKKKIACIKCKAGGLSGFLSGKADSLKNYEATIDGDLTPGYSAISTVATYIGMSDYQGTKDVQFQKMAKSVEESIQLTIQRSQKWIEERNLDIIFCFNGRMDLTNAVMRAAEKKGIPFVSVERSWHGQGIQLTVDGTPLNLKTFYSFISDWREKPLTNQQIFKAFKIIAHRFQKKAVGEFRQYNFNQKLGLISDSERAKWLYLPSSIFERIGHPDWKVCWEDDLDAIQKLIKSGMIKAQELIVRGHPQWTTFSPQSDKKYKDWCQKIGATYIPSNSEVSTQELIWISETVIVYGSSAALEAGLLGKKIINLSPTFYYEGGFLRNIISEEDIFNRYQEMSPKEIIRKCLRTIYTINFRYMQLTNEIQAVDPYHYLFTSISDSHFFTNLVSRRQISPDDQTSASNLNDENQFLDQYLLDIFQNLSSKTFLESFDQSKIEKGTDLKRKWTYVIVDVVDKRF